MIEADPWLKKRVRVYESKRMIVTKQGRNKLKVLSADGRRQHGQNPSIVILDEVHTQPNRKLHDALATAFGARREPLMILISTAGNERGTLIHDEYLYACKVRDGTIDDPTYLPIIYEASPEDDWTDERTWAKAMPALGDFVSYDHFRAIITRAMADPNEEAAFKQFYLNLWVASATKWLNREGWDLCGKHRYPRESLLGRKCWAGLDLSNTSDLTAFVQVFPWDDDTFRVLPHFWIPEAYARKRDGQGSTKYIEWARLGLITLTPGSVIDHDLIKAKIFELKKLHKIEKVLADPFNAQQIAQQLVAGGLKVEMMRQGTISMNEPLKSLGVLIAKEQLHHNDNAVLNWQADNCVSVRDSQGNIRLDKEASADKIDGMVSLVMGLAGAILEKPKPKSSVSFLRA
jgi:phage terminase large subunit-like protein